MSVALTVIGALIDDELHGAVALMDRARPVPHRGGAKTVQLDITKMSLGDLIAVGAAFFIRREGRSQ